MNEPLYEGSFVVIDLETTGFSVENSDIIEIGAVKVEGGIISETYSRLIYPGYFLPRRVTEITGITNAMVIGQPTIGEVIFIGCNIVVGHNVKQDIKFLEKYTKIYMGKKLKIPHICTLQLARNLFPGMGNYTLHNLADNFGITYKKVHRALDDAMTTARLFMVMLEFLWKNMGISSYIDIRQICKSVNMQKC